MLEHNVMYGAGAKKLEAIANSGLNGTQIKSTFYAKYPAIKELVDALEKSYDVHGTYIKTLDGRRVYIRSKHKLLNTLIQSAAAIIFKQWMLEIHGILPTGGNQVIAMHDEVQVEFSGNKLGATLLGEEMCRLAEVVGKDLGIKVPVTAEAKVSKTWRGTH